MQITAKNIIERIEKALNTDISPAGCRPETVILNAASVFARTMALFDILKDIDLDAFVEVYKRTRERREQLLNIEERIYKAM